MAREEVCVAYWGSELWFGLKPSYRSRPRKPSIVMTRSTMPDTSSWACWNKPRPRLHKTANTQSMSPKRFHLSCALPGPDKGPPGRDRALSGACRPRRGVASAHLAGNRAKISGCKSGTSSRTSASEPSIRQRLRSIRCSMRTAPSVASGREPFAKPCVGQSMSCR